MVNRPARTDRRGAQERRVEPTASRADGPRLSGVQLRAILLVVVMVLSVLAVPIAVAQQGNASQNGGEGGGNQAGPPDEPGGGSASGSNGNAGAATDGSNGNAGQTDGDSKGTAGEATDNSGGPNGNSNGKLGETNGNANGNAGEVNGNSNGNAGEANGNSNGNAGEAGGPPATATGGNGAGPAQGADQQGGAPASDPGRSGAAAAPGDRGNGPDSAQGDGATGAGPPDDVGSGPAISVRASRAPDGGGPNQAQGRPADRPSDDERPSVVRVAVAGAQAGDRVSVDTTPSTPADEAVAFDGIDLTVARGGAFTMTVTNSRDPIPGSPRFEPGDAADPLGHIRLEHSITNEEVEEVSLTFRVSKARLSAKGVDSEEVALYRYADGGWTALPTDVVGETAAHYRFEADSPGMSEFAVGAKRPSFEVHWAETRAVQASPGDPVLVSGRISNVGAADGVYEATLHVDGDAVATRQVTIAAGGTRQVNFEQRFDRPGRYTVTVDRAPAGEVEVVARTADGGPPAVDTVVAAGLELILKLGQSLRLARLPTVATG